MSRGDFVWMPGAPIHHRRGPNVIDDPRLSDRTTTPGAAQCGECGGSESTAPTREPVRDVNLP